MGTLSLVFGRDNEDGLWVKVTVTKPATYNERCTKDDAQRTMNRKDNRLFIVHRLTFIVPK
jgi:hypothetical protein